MNNKDKLTQYNSLREIYQIKVNQLQHLIKTKPSNELQHMESVYSYRVSAIDRCIENVKKEVETK